MNRLLCVLMLCIPLHTHTAQEDHPSSKRKEMENPSTPAAGESPPAKRQKIINANSEQEDLLRHASLTPLPAAALPIAPTPTALPIPLTSETSVLPTIIQALHTQQVQIRQLSQNQVVLLECMNKFLQEHNSTESSPSTPALLSPAPEATKPHTQLATLVEQHASLLQAHKTAIDDHASTIDRQTTAIKEHIDILTNHADTLDGHASAIAALNKKIEEYAAKKNVVADLPKLDE